jgi:GT2 family glycosyltransferase
VTTPRVSVYIPVYNTERWLAQAIQSVLDQTLRDLELLVVDDGSSDESLRIARAFAHSDPRMRVESLAHAGISAASNHAVALARAPLIARMDADDVARADRLEKQVAFLDRHPEVGVVGGQTRVIDAAGRTLRYSSFPCAAREIRQRSLEGCMVWQPTSTMRRELLLAAGGYRSCYDYVEDYDLWLRLLEHCELANLPDVVLDYRWHENNVSVTHRRRQTILAIATRASAIGRRNTGVDPCPDLPDATVAALMAIPLDAPSRSEWLARCFLILARRDPTVDPDLLAWFESEAAWALAHAPDDRVRRDLARAFLNRVAFEIGRRRPGTALSHLVSALRAAPEVVWQRVLGRLGVFK